MKEIILKIRPKEMPLLSDFEIRESSIKELNDGEVLYQIEYLSVDPYMRGRMNDRPSYTPPFKLGEPIVGAVVAKIIESKFEGLKKGDHVYGYLPWKEQGIAKGDELKKLDPRIAPITTALGVLGMPGMTAYFGLLDIGKPKVGETVVVSGAAGAVGSLVGQIAKIKGCHVVGIAGSQEKGDYLIKELGFDAFINYKDPDFKEALAKACPQGIDVYFDNVGGDVTDQVIRRLNKFARIVLCGQIALYNLDKIDTGPRNWLYLLTKSALVQGFIIFDYQDRYPEGMKQMAEWIQEGKIKYRETITEGFENAPKAFLGLFNGENIGKQIVQV